MYYSLTILESLLKKISSPGENEAYVVPMFPCIVFVSAFRENRNLYFIVDLDTYQIIRGIGWTSSNGYIRMSSKPGTYLQRFIFQNVPKGFVVHHMSHLFVYMISFLCVMSKKDHPENRTYTAGTLSLGNKKIMVKFLKSLGIKRKLKLSANRSKHYKMIPRGKEK